MSNTWGGDCYECGLWVKPETGHLEKYRKGWRIRHAIYEGHGAITCEMAAKKAKDPALTSAYRKDE